MHPLSAHTRASAEPVGTLSPLIVRLVHAAHSGSRSPFRVSTLENGDTLDWPWNASHDFALFDAKFSAGEFAEIKRLRDIDYVCEFSAARLYTWRKFGANKKRNFHDTVDRRSPSMLRVPVQFHFPMIIGLLFIRTFN